VDRGRRQSTLLALQHLTCPRIAGQIRKEELGWLGLERPPSPWSWTVIPRGTSRCFMTEAAIKLVMKEGKVDTSLPYAELANAYSSRVGGWFSRD